VFQGSLRIKRERGLVLVHPLHEAGKQESNVFLVTDKVVIHHQYQLAGKQKCEPMNKNRI
jgi:hypothetical protein